MSSNGRTGSTYQGDYQISSSGVNDQGSYYQHRDYGSGAANSNSYYYSNATRSDGTNSYYYANSDNSTYYNDGRGNSTYTSPSGNVTHKST